jgi:quercetin dioxygenase-like cupin family protein
MEMRDLHVSHWEAANAPTEALLKEIMRQQNLDPLVMTHSPHDTYFAHKHNYHKVVYVVRGTVIFNLTVLKKKFVLIAGDRFDLPAGIVHSVEIGAEGALFLEGQVK